MLLVLCCDFNETGRNDSPPGIRTAAAAKNPDRTKEWHFIGKITYYLHKALLVSYKVYNTVQERKLWRKESKRRISLLVQYNSILSSSIY